MASTHLISAYFAICFPSFTYYVTTLSCTIGRRSIPSSNVDAVPVHVDIDLGPLKSVSRLHARIEYDEELDGFVICILGRNGAWIDGIWAKSGSRVPLSSRTNIQIASRTFQFLLAIPPQTESLAEQSPTSSLVEVVEGDGDAMAPVDVEGYVIDVDNADDDGPPLPAKRSGGMHSTGSATRPAKKSKVAEKKKSQKSRNGANAISNGSRMTTPPPPLVVNAEDRRLNRRRAELESKIHAALGARSTSVPTRVVCIPIRIDVHPSSACAIDTPAAEATSTQQPLALKNGEIVLSSKLFSHVTADQLQLLRRLETPKVLEILTAEFKKSLVEEYRAERMKTKHGVTSNGANVTASAK